MVRHLGDGGAAALNIARRISLDHRRSVEPKLKLPLQYPGYVPKHHRELKLPPTRHRATVGGRFIGGPAP